MRSPRKYKKRKSPRTEPGGTSSWRGQTDEVKLVTSKSKHTVLEVSCKNIASVNISSLLPDVKIIFWEMCAQTLV